MDTKKIIGLCKLNNRKAQKMLYDYYSADFYNICKRYAGNLTDAEDILSMGFIKIFTKINQYKDKGSFEGWMKRIIINESLMYLRKKKTKPFSIDIGEPKIIPQLKSIPPSIESNLEERDILGLLNKLPKGYRTVFNLYVIEGYKHREIAEILGISINTSKSQLILARKRLAILYNNLIKERQ